MTGVWPVEVIRPPESTVITRCKAATLQSRTAPGSAESLTTGSSSGYGDLYLSFDVDGLLWLLYFYD